MVLQTTTNTCNMGDRSPIILTERKKRRMAAKAKEEMNAQLESEKSVDALDTLVSEDNNNNNNNNMQNTIYLYKMV